MRMRETDKYWRIHSNLEGKLKLLTKDTDPVLIQDDLIEIMKLANELGDMAADYLVKIQANGEIGE